MELFSDIVPWAMVLGIGSVIVFFIVKRLRLIKVHGAPKIPDDITVLRRSFGKYEIIVTLSDFRAAGNYKNINFLYERFYEEENGRWILKIEMKEGHVIAYYAEYISRISFFLNTSFYGNVGRSRLIHELTSD